MLKSSAAAAHFGVALVALGIAMLLVGIAYHVSFMVGLRRERAEMKADGLVHAQSQFPVSLTLMVAVLLLGSASSPLSAWCSMSGHSVERDQGHSERQHGRK